MRKKIYLILMVFLFASSVCALTTDLKQKYPYTVLTDDYGILNGRDLDSKLDGVFPPTEFPSGKHFFLYWQCFPREQVRISLNDIGYSSFNLDENDAELTITVYTSSGAHLYGNRRNSAVSSSIKTLNEYQRIMRGQHYICLEGTYFFYKDSVADGKKMRTYYWTFEKMKTMKGCVSYFSGRCHDKKIKGSA